VYIFALFFVFFSHATHLNNSSSNPSKPVSITINSNQDECEDKKRLYVCVWAQKRYKSLGIRLNKAKKAYLLVLNEWVYY
jgi:hypothetical protein